MPDEVNSSPAVDPLVSLAAALTASQNRIAPLPPDVIDDKGPLVRSSFDARDISDDHPVDSDAPVTQSSFDREDRVDDHPVP